MKFSYIFPSKSAKNVFPREKKRKSLRENQMSRSQKIRIYQQQQEQKQEEAWKWGKARKSNHNNRQRKARNIIENQRKGNTKQPDLWIFLKGFLPVF